MKSNYHYIDKMFRDELHDYREEPQDDLWNGISAELTSGSVVESPSKGISITKFFWILLTVGTVSVSTSLLLNRNKAEVEPLERGKLESSGDLPKDVVEETTTKPLGETSHEQFTDGIKETENADGRKIDTGKYDIAQTIPHGQDGIETAEDAAIGSGQGGLALGDVNSVGLDMILFIPPPEAFNFPKEQFNTPLAIDSTLFQNPDSLSWKWFASPGLVISSSYRESSVFRAELKIGRYFNNRSFIQAGVILDTNPLTVDIPLNYNYLLGSKRIKGLIQGGATLSFQRHFGFRDGFSTVQTGFTLGAGALYNYNSRMRILVLPYFDSNYSDLLFQVGIQLKF